MKRQTLPWMLGFFLVTSAGSFGCDDGDPPRAPDASAQGGAGGAAGAGGAGGKGGSGGAKASGGAGGGGVDASPDLPGTGGASDADPGTGGTAGTDAGTDTTTEVDMASPSPDMASVETAPEVSTAPDASLPTMNVNTCGDLETKCKALFDITKTCNAAETDCTQQVGSAGPPKVTNYCYENDIKKQKTETTANGQTTEVIKVNKENGAHCFTLEKSQKTNDPIEPFTYKDPSGTVLATGHYNADTEVVTITCGGVNYVLAKAITGTCAGTESEQACSTGACAP